MLAVWVVLTVVSAALFERARDPDHLAMTGNGSTGA